MDALIEILKVDGIAIIVAVVLLIIILIANIIKSKKK